MTRLATVIHNAYDAVIDACVTYPLRALDWLDGLLFGRAKDED